MFDILKRLIEKKFYKTKTDAEKKIEVFYATEKLDDIEYTDLTLLVAEKYPE